MRQGFAEKIYNYPLGLLNTELRVIWYLYLRGGIISALLET